MKASFESYKMRVYIIRHGETKKNRGKSMLKSVLRECKSSDSLDPHGLPKPMGLAKPEKSEKFLNFSDFSGLPPVVSPKGRNKRFCRKATEPVVGLFSSELLGLGSLILVPFLAMIKRWKRKFLTIRI